MSMAHAKQDDFAARIAAVPTYHPRRVPHASETPSFMSFFRNVVSNPLGAVPSNAYRGKSKLCSWPMAQVLFANDPDVVEEVLLRSNKSFPKSPVDQIVFGSAAEKGMLIASGDDWKWRRKMAAPFFQPRALEHLIPHMIEPFEDLVATWKTRPTGTPIYGTEAMIRATFEMITATLFSREEREIISEFPVYLEEYLEPIPWIMGTATLGLPKWVPYPGRNQFLQGIVKMRSSIEAALEHRRENGSQRRDLTNDMLNACDDETGRKFTNVDIVDMLMTMIGAGHETTAHAMTWMLYNLAKQPDLQELLAEEVETALDSKPLDGQSLREMNHLEAFIKESMRVHPSVPLITRVSNKEQEIGGFHLKKDAVIFIPILAIHRHEDLWDNPNLFDHTRFLRAEPSTLSRTTYFPFGAGPRVCIGNAFAMMEMVAGIATLLQHVRLRPAANCDDFTFMHLLTLKPSNGLPLDVEFI